MLPKDTFRVCALLLTESLLLAEGGGAEILLLPEDNVADLLLGGRLSDGFGVSNDGVGDCTCLEEEEELSEPEEGILAMR